jgi:hypothetical protein
VRKYPHDLRSLLSAAWGFGDTRSAHRVYFLVLQADWTAQIGCSGNAIRQTGVSCKIQEIYRNGSVTYSKQKPFLRTAVNYQEPDSL